MRELEGPESHYFGVGLRKVQVMGRRTQKATKVEETKKVKKNTDRLSDEEVRVSVILEGAGKEREGKRRNAVLVLLSERERIREGEREAR